MPKKKTTQGAKSEKDNETRTLVLLDAHAIIHRAYHALPDFTTKTGEPTGGLYGIAAMLIKIINDLKPDYIAACYDLPGPTFRKEIYEAYKAGRPKADEALVHQINRSRDIFKAFDIPIYEAAGFEADDIIGTISEKIKKIFPGVKVVIASGDMDTLQLVSNDNILVYTLRKGLSDTILYNEARVTERFGFGPELLPDFKGLRGDPSDNIPGIRGIGEKTASLLIGTFGALESLYQQLKKKNGEEMFAKAGLKPRIISLLKENEEEAFFSKTLAEIRRDVPIDFSLPEKSWKESFAPAPVEKLFHELEFRSLADRMHAMAAGATHNVVPPQENGTPRQNDAPIDSREAEKTALALWLLDSSMTSPAPEDMYEYAGTTSFARAKEHIFAELKKNRLDKVYTEIEEPLVPVLRRAEDRGIKIDALYLKKLSEEYHKKISVIEKRIWKSAGFTFNLNSPKQLAEVLFDRLSLSVKGLKKTEGGARSTRAGELEKLRGAHPVIDDILEYREYQKLLSTYIDAIPPLIGTDGRLHTDFIQTGTTTGRIASANPNLQNIPIKTESGRKIRRAFVADTGYILAAFDYSQIELRIAAVLSGDEKLINIFRRGEDVHAGVAAEVFRVSESEVTKEMRRKAKVINFGILYGMGLNALRGNLGTGREEAAAFYEKYFGVFTGLAAYIERTKRDAAKKGYTETYFGRRRYFPEIKSKIPYIRSAAERMAINAPIQGTQADIIKLAMVRIDRWIAKEKLRDDVRLLLQIHDELIFEIKKDRFSEVAPHISRIMEAVLPDAPLPIIANVSFGQNWGEME
ncbi:MAG: hypothetical protein COW88_01940 [Candidatus Lloydbacteria bacterium CG22_combo_CG10-13_8_21_14_all_47_15]|uniref:DNA-directed DNA polymerase n=1 Tax=Candidatus Lloydbacteria bacterium CG22_combo_CG10-13_8_21_14_all_47_15 TaxID=1974635 RepID=A0A2H0CVL0_9BACT|nr:MAG: hypothetical protein COW88_01940 [Candidatus Lloydbacteria bacterium CG22_combo_CG10-13_8_21_14_all_47_15]